MIVHGVTPILNVSDMDASSRGSPSWAGRSCGAGATPRDSAPLAPVRARSSCVAAAKGGAGKGRT